MRQAALSAPAERPADDSVLGRWWDTVDHWTLFAVATLIGFGYAMMLAASPAVAERIHVERDAFIIKQVVFLLLGGAIVVGVSMLKPRQIRRLALVGCIVAIALTAWTIGHGLEIKGARRWINLPGFSLQPSEFIKPCFAVLAAWLLAEANRTRRFPGMLASGAIFVVIAVLLQAQPDMGMLAVVGLVFFVQLFIAGLNLMLVGVGFGLIAAGSVAAYTFFPHVQSRVERFLDPASGDNYQVITALQAFGHGGLLGRGPGEGSVKDILPDAHADFVFAVMGEEFGMLICLFVICVFGFIVIRGLLKLVAEHDLFVVLAAAGLVTSFGLQSCINMASSLHLMPTKGMTLPFISYGGSSVLSVALDMGMLLALTRKRGRGDRWEGVR
jgi:cell division protein FtsW